MAGVSMKDIKSRIKSMESTKQITKAMEMVAASKLRRAGLFYKLTNSNRYAYKEMRALGFVSIFFVLSLKISELLYIKKITIT